MMMNIVAVVQDPPQPETETTTSEPEITNGEAESVTVSDGGADVTVQYIEPSQTTKYEQLGYDIDLIHSITLGDIVIATLLAMLIVVTLLSRLLGGR